MQDRHLCCPPTFSLASQWPPNFFISRIASGRGKAKKRGLTVSGLVKAQSIVHIVFQLHDFLRFDPTLVVNVLTNTSSPKLNNQSLFYFEV